MIIASFVLTLCCACHLQEECLQPPRQQSFSLEKYTIDSRCNIFGRPSTPTDGGDAGGDVKAVAAIGLTYSSSSYYHHYVQDLGR